MSVVYIYVALVSYNVEVMTPPLGAIETVVDDAAKVAVLDGRGRLVRERKGGGNVGGDGGGGDWKERRRGGGGGCGGGGGISGGRNGKKSSGGQVNQQHEHGQGRGQGCGHGGSGGRAGENGHHRPRWERQQTGLDAWCVGTDAVLDIPLAGVCEILYARREWGGTALGTADENGMCS